MYIRCRLCAGEIEFFTYFTPAINKALLLHATYSDTSSGGIVIHGNGVKDRLLFHAIVRLIEI